MLSKRSETIGEIDVLPPKMSCFNKSNSKVLKSLRIPAPFVQKGPALGEKIALILHNESAKSADCDL